MRLRYLTILLVVCFTVCAVYWNRLLASPETRRFFFGPAIPPPGPGLNHDGPALGSLAPDFTLTSVTGDTVSLSDYRGRPVILALGSYT